MSKCGKSDNIQGMKMKNAKSFSLRLREKLNENRKLFYSDNKNGDKFQEGRDALFSLLSDHPYFNTEVKSLRGKYDIPKGGFNGAQVVFLWEHQDLDSNHNFVEDVYKLVASFKIPEIYERSVWHFFYNYIIYPKRAEKESTEKLPFAHIVKTDKDREINKYLINPSSTYIEVFNWTTSRDMGKVLKKLNANKIKKLPFKVSKVGFLARMIWKLSQDKLSDKEIAHKINTAYKQSDVKHTIGDTEVPVYRKNYKNALSALRKIE